MSEKENQHSEQKEAPATVTPNRIIGLGASAGGLEALQTFFKNCRADTGDAYIAVQHLSPDYKSLMNELLERYTKMPVSYAEDGETIEANHVYLITPRNNLRVAEGKLLLSDQLPDSGLNFPIDTLFRSLAEDQQHNAVGIVLSGTGSDGTRGSLAINEAGGVVIVQESSSAQFDGMPRSAEASGIANMVLPPEQMPEALRSYFSHPLIKGETQGLKDTLKENADILEEIFDAIKQHNDLDLRHYKPSTVVRRIERRLGINQLSSLQEYRTLLQQDPIEKRVLAKDFLIGVTRFFRDSEAFEMLQENIFPVLMHERNDHSPIRVWVAGCSTGEEPYSLAIAFNEEMTKQGISRPIKIFATDVDPDAVNEAASGEFAENIMQDVPSHLLKKYFHSENGKFTVTNQLRKMVVFAQHNLITDPPFSNMDMVSCRNTLIYLQPEVQRKVMTYLHFALRLNGILFLGSSESLGNLKNYFSVIDSRLKIFRKAVDARLVLENQQRTQSEVRHSMNKVLSARQTLVSPKPTPLQNDMYRVNQRLLDSFVPPTIVLNDRLEAIHTYGRISPYIQKLKPGRVTMSIKDLLVESISVAALTAIHRAIKTQSDVNYTDVALDSDEYQGDLTIRVFYVGDVNAGLLNLMLVFEEQNTGALVALRDNTDITISSPRDAIERVEELELELADSREHLHATVEELETTNEELQSTNEELMASNEELQSTNEELQSVNEELYTVNNEYQLKIEELTQLNDDLNNFMKATQIATIFLSNDIKVRKYTQAATRYFNLLPMDLERPLDHISHKLNIDDLISRVRHVILRREMIEQEVSTADKTIVLLKLIPYLTADNTADGVVITITDISEVNEGLQTNLTVELLEDDLTRMKSRCAVLKASCSFGFWNWNIKEDAIVGDTEFYACLGYAPEEIAHYEDFMKIVHPDDLEKVRDNVSVGLGSRDVMQFDYRVLQKSGKVISIKSHGVVRYNELDHPQEWIGSLTVIDD